MRKKVGLSHSFSRRRVLVGLGIQSEVDLDIYQGVVDFFAAGARFDVVPIGMDFERRVSELAAVGGVDGVIGEFAGGGWLTALQRQGIPVVHIRQNFAVGDLPSVGVDYRAAGQLGGRFLAECGVSRIIWVGSTSSLVAREVFAGVCADFRGEIRPLPLDFLLQNPRGARGSCLCFVEPRVAGPLARAIHRHRLSVPRDIAMLSFGRSVQASLWTGLDLSAVPFPWRQVGRTAAAKLAHILEFAPSQQGRKKGTGPLATPSSGSPKKGTGPSSGVDAVEEKKGTGPSEAAAEREWDLAPGGWVEVVEVYRGGSVERVGEGQVVVRRALALVGERMEEGLRVGEVARLLGVSRRKLEMAFKGRGLRPPHGEFEGLRIERAEGLLRATSVSVGEIGNRCGYSSVHAFSAAFKRATGESPRRIRTLHLQRGEDVS